MKYPKLEFKPVIARLNLKNNMFGIRNTLEAESFFYTQLDQVRNMKSYREFYEKLSLFNFLMTMTFGDRITRKCFNEILKYCDIDFEDLRAYIYMVKTESNIPLYKWFLDLEAVR